MASRARPQVFDELIVGAGPAGLNGALACARTRTTVLIFDSQEYRSEGVKYMHTVASRDHMDPLEFIRTAREQIESSYDTIWFQEATITHAAKKKIGPEQYDGFEVQDADGNTYQGKKLVLATGAKDVLPDIEGYNANWPEHIYQCLGCDGYGQSGMPIGFLNFDSPVYVYLVKIAAGFKPTSITLFSNGPISKEEPMQKAVRLAQGLGATLDERKIVRLINNSPSYKDGVTIEFESGPPSTYGFLVHRPATVNRGQELIEQLGVETEDPAMGGHIKIVNTLTNETSVRGVFAGGDTMAMMKQVVVAMSEGLKAAIGAGLQVAQEDAEMAAKALEREKRGRTQG